MRHTPLKTFDNFDEFQLGVNDFVRSIDHRSYIDLIVRDASQYLIPALLQGIEEKMWIAPKVKILNDVGDNRVSSYIMNEKVISVMCGKIDAIPALYAEIERAIF